MTQTGLMLLVLAIPVTVMAWLVVRRVAKRRRRAAALAVPFPEKWEEYLRLDVPLFGRMPPESQEQLRQRMKVFLAEKNFEGCGGLELTEEMRVAIAAYACLLILNRKTDYYPKLDTILVYPAEYVVEATTVVGGQYAREKRVHLGESWDRGVVVLAWDELLLNAEGVDDGVNVAIHEFAHQLDQEDGRDADGVPILEGRERYAAWIRIFGGEYERHKNAVRGRGEYLIDEYGAEDPAEFFAVVSETFFEWPLDLKERHPDLYAQLAAYYRLDPASWDWTVIKSQ